jgi:hypothetical protein
VVGVAGGEVFGVVELGVVEGGGRVEGGVVLD